MSTLDLSSTANALSGLGAAGGSGIAGALGVTVDEFTSLVERGGEKGSINTEGASGAGSANYKGAKELNPKALQEYVA